MPDNLVNKIKIFMGKIFTQWHSAAKSPSVTQAVIWNGSNGGAMASPDPLTACRVQPRAGMMGLSYFYL